MFSVLRQSVSGLRNIHSMSSRATPGPVESTMRTKLSTLFQPTSIRITNDSWQHRHHAAMQGNDNGETHFSIEIISSAFENRTTIQRHRMVYAALSEEFGQGVHALSLNTKTEAEAQRLQMTFDT